jgi:hypothetical protein
MISYVYLDEWKSPSHSLTMESDPHVRIVGFPDIQQFHLNDSSCSHSEELPMKNLRFEAMMGTRSGDIVDALETRVCAS